MDDDSTDGQGSLMDGMNRTAERPAGWYPDPEDGARYRWWDGSSWTDQTSVPLDAPADPDPPAAPVDEPAPENPVGPAPSGVAEEPAPPSRDRNGSRRRWLLGALAAVVLLGAGAVGGVLVFGGVGQTEENVAQGAAAEEDENASEDVTSTPSGSPTTADDGRASGAEPETTPTPSPEPARADFNGSVPLNTWTVVLESLDGDEHTWGEAGMRAEEYAAAGVSEVDVIFSSDYSSLNPGYWVVIAGSWNTENDAASYCREIRDIAETCYQRYVSNDEEAGTASPTSSSLDAAVAKVRSKGFEPIETNGYEPGSTLQVIIGMAEGSADGYAKHAFFFVRGEYIGTDTLETSASISLAWQDDTTIALTYSLYDPDDPMCCPTGSATVRYWWNGSKLEPLDPIPPFDWDAYGSRR